MQSSDRTGQIVGANKSGGVSWKDQATMRFAVAESTGRPAKAPSRKWPVCETALSGRGDYDVFLIIMFPNEPRKQFGTCMHVNYPVNRSHVIMYRVLAEMKLRRNFFFG
jgi:hypothetical protein